MATTLNNIRAQVSSFPSINDDSSAYLNTLLVKKHEINTSKMRKLTIKHYDELQPEFLAISNTLTNTKFASEKMIRETEKPLESEAPQEEEVSVKDEELQHLRQRLIGGVKTVNSEKQNEMEELKQEDAIENMFDLVRSLREGAQVFQQALADDKPLIDAASQGLDKFSHKLVNVSGNLKKFDAKKLSWKFYVGIVLFMVFSLIMTFIIVHITPS